MVHANRGCSCSTSVHYSPVTPDWGLEQHANDKVIPLSRNGGRRISGIGDMKLWSHRKHAGELEKAYQMPLASGQSLAIKAHVNNGETGLSNKKWS